MAGLPFHAGIGGSTNQHTTGAMHPHLFRRQFFAAPRAVPGFDGWHAETLGPMHVRSHPELQLTRAGGGDGALEVVLIGFALDPARPELDNAALARRLAVGAGIDDVVAAALDLAGRWALLVHAAGELYALHDACGLRMVHYTRGADGPLFASSPALLGRLAALTPAAHAHAYRQSRYRREGVEHWMPSGMTLFTGVGHLVPNHYLRASSAEQVRFWPVRPIGRLTPAESVARAALLLRALVQAAAARFPLALPISAGFDSRVVLAASQPLAAALYPYTLIYRDLNAQSADVRIPAQMLAGVGLPHHVIDCRRAPSPGFSVLYRDSVDDAHEDWERMAYGMDQEYPADRVALKGNGAEIARNTNYASLQPHPTAESIARFELGGAELPFMTAAVERWFGPAKEASDRAGIDVLDLFYWEHRMGSWQARSQLEWDSVQEAYTPFSHRPLLEALLAVPWRDRKPPRYAVWKALIRALWPRLMEWPVNPLPLGKRLRSGVRNLMESAGLVGPLRRAYRALRAAAGR